MKILVPVKRVVTTTSRVKSDGTAWTSPTSRSSEPFDEIAVEEAVRLKRRGATEVTQYSCVTQCQGDPAHRDVPSAPTAPSWSRPMRRTAALAGPSCRGRWSTRNSPA